MRQSEARDDNRDVNRFDGTGGGRTVDPPGVTPSADPAPDGDRPPSPGRVRRARRAVAVIFAVHGAVSGTFATRVPWLREQLDLGTGWLGFALVFTTVGAALSMPWAARLAHRHGPRATMRALAALAGVALALPACSPGLPWLCGALLVYGAALGVCDVAMNAQGVEIEARLGRSVMSGLHGVWSVGTLLGGAVGVWAAHAGLDARVHLGLAGPLLGVVGASAARWTLDTRSGAHAEEPPPFAWPSRAVLAVGLVGFCAVFAEGASMDWSAVYLRDVLHTEPWLGAAAYTTFAYAMTLARLLGDLAVRRLGPVRTVRCGGVVTVAGGALVVGAHGPGAALPGFALIGVGVAVVVPLCFAAAGRVGEARGDRQALAGVATLSYAAGLAAPAAVGWVAEATSLRTSFGVVSVLALGLVLGAGVLRSEGPAAPEAGDGAGPDASRRPPLTG